MSPRHAAIGRDQRVGGIAPNTQAITDFQRAGKVGDVLGIDTVAEQQSNRDDFATERLDHFFLGQQTAGLVCTAKSSIVPDVDEHRLSGSPRFLLGVSE